MIFRLLFASVGRRQFDIDSHRPFINEFASQVAGNGNEQSGEHRKVNAPRPDQCIGAVDAEQPIKRGQGEEHYCQGGVAPGSNQAADTRHRDQIDQADAARNPTSQCADPGEPEAGARPEIIIAQQIGAIGRYQSHECSNRKMDQHRVDRMTQKGHFAHDRVLHRVLLSVGLLGLTLLAGCSGPLSTLDPAGPSAHSAALLWWSMFAYAIVVFVAVVALWLCAIRRPADTRDESQQWRVHHQWIIGGGVILPSVSILALLVFGVPMGHRMLPLPLAGGEALRIDVTGHQWWWEVRYPASRIALKNELHIPAGTPIDIHLTTADVIHGFWVPRLGGKLDAIPGRTNVLRLQADKPGVYRGQCAEFCGLHHAGMQFTVTAHPPEEFTRWVEAQPHD